MIQAFLMFTNSSLKKWKKTGVDVVDNKLTKLLDSDCHINFIENIKADFYSMVAAKQIMLKLKNIKRKLKDN